MDKPHAPYLFFMGAGEFAVVKDTPWRGKVPVEYYVEKDYAPLAKKLFGNTSEMMTFFSERFGYDYPWAKYAQIIVRDFVTGAMENTTAVSHSESAYQSEEALNDQNYWEYIIAHELAHHWFGDLVTAESWANLTVNESFANYSEYLWLAHKYGKDVADYHLRNNTQQYHQRPDDFKKDWYVLTILLPMICSIWSPITKEELSYICFATTLAMRRSFRLLLTISKHTHTAMEKPISYAFPLRR